MELKKKKKYNVCLMIGFMLFIFYMSSQTGDDSTKQSNFILDIFTSLGINLNESFGEFASTIIRKGAHFTEYMILSFLIYNVITDYIKINKKVYIYTVLGVFLYAVTDEIHQLFVPGRAGMIQDVMIDTSGGLAGTLILIIKLNLQKKRCQRSR
ncbi:MAG: VanZ family protein [Sarcina sp.]